MTELTLFDELPADVPDGVPATVYGHRANTDAGHLLIESADGDWLFLDHGTTTIRCCLPRQSLGVDLTAEQLRVLGDYCHRIANRIENR